MMRLEFSPSVRRAISRAREEAAYLRHNRVGSEHLLLALLSSGDATTLRLLDHCGISAADVRQAIEAAVQPGHSRAAPAGRSELLYTQSAMELLEDMMWRARSAESSVILSEHILSALVQEGRGLAGAVLRQLGVTAEVLRSMADETSIPPSQRFEVEIDNVSDQSIYEQIVAQVQEGIATGELQPGERLPPVRGLADRLNIAPGTVARAYNELERLGLVITQGARGTRVADRRKQTTSLAGRLETLVGLLRPVAVAAFHMGASAEELRRALEEAMKDILGNGPESTALDS